MTRIDSWRLFFKKKKLGKLVRKYKKLIEEMKESGAAGSLTSINEELNEDEEMAEYLDEIDDHQPIRKNMFARSQTFARANEIKSKTFSPNKKDQNMERLLLRDEILKLKAECKKLIHEKTDENDWKQKAKFLDSPLKKKLASLVYANLKNFGHWINSSSFIVSYTLVAYTIFNLPDNARDEPKGMVNLQSPLFMYSSGLSYSLSQSCLSLSTS